MIFADSGITLNDLGTLFNLGVLGLTMYLWVTKKITVVDNSERDYLRAQIKQLDIQLVDERKRNTDLQESVRKEVVPALTDVARVLPIIIDRLTK